MLTPESIVIGPISEAFLFESIVILLVTFCVFILIGILFIAIDESKFEDLTAKSCQLT